MSITEYSPFTCYTAGRLREIGFSIPEAIPDCGYVPIRECEIMAAFPPQSSQSGSLNHTPEVVFSVKTNVPFKWEGANQCQK